MDKAGLLKMLERVCAKAGSQAAWAAKHGLAQTYVSDVVRGRKLPGPKVLAALQMERVVLYRKVGGRFDTD